MKTAAIIIAMFGILNMRAIPQAFQLSNPRWLLMLLAGVFGVLLFSLAIGIWFKKKFAWYLGFVGIAWGSAYFLARILYALPHDSNSQKLVISVSCVGVAALVAGFWSVIWYHQKRWFL